MAAIPEPLFRDLCRTGRARGHFVWRLECLQSAIPIDDCITQFVVRKYRIARARPLELALVRNLCLQIRSGKDGRRELKVHIPYGRWSFCKQVFLHRLVAWEFYRPCGMDWSEFNRRLANGSFSWQVDHLHSDPRMVVAGGLEIIRRCENLRRFWDCPAFGVMKRPASAPPRRGQGAPPREGRGAGAVAAAWLDKARYRSVYLSL